MPGIAGNVEIQQWNASRRLRLWFTKGSPLMISPGVVPFLQKASCLTNSLSFMAWAWGSLKFNYAGKRNNCCS
jgi:hypothetical protein